MCQACALAVPFGRTDNTRRMLYGHKSFAYAFHLLDVAHAVVVLRLTETRAGQSSACDDEGLGQKGGQRFYRWNGCWSRHPKQKRSRSQLGQKRLPAALNNHIEKMHVAVNSGRLLSKTKTYPTTHEETAIRSQRRPKLQTAIKHNYYKKGQTATKPHLERRTAIQNKTARQQQIAIKHKTTKAANRYELALFSLTCISALTHEFCLRMKCGCPPPEQHRSKYVDAPSIRAAKGRFLLV